MNSSFPHETRCLWCGERICQKRDANDTIQATYYEEGEQQGNRLLYYVRDHLGSVTDTIDAQGNPQGALDYSPYGETIGEGALPDFRYAGMFNLPETGLYLTHYRLYDPSSKRWLNRDPIGETGGINTYAYADGSPTTRTDPLGLKTFMCTKPLNRFGGDGARSGPDIWGNPLYHQYSCVVDKNGNVTCGGQDRGKGGVGKPSNDSMEAGQCKETQPDNDCFETCLIDEWKKPRPKYGIPFGTDCQEYDDDVNQRCRKQCKLK